MCLSVLSFFYSSLPLSFPLCPLFFFPSTESIEWSPTKCEQYSLDSMSEAEGLLSFLFLVSPVEFVFSAFHPISHISLLSLLLSQCFQKSHAHSPLRQYNMCSHSLKTIRYFINVDDLPTRRIVE